MGDEVDLMAHLEQKRKDLAAMQEAANVAKEQALALLRLQRRVAEIDAMANGTDLPPEVSADVGMLAPGAVAANSQAFQQASGNSSSSLTIEDRRRFGLDANDGPQSGISASLKLAEAQSRAPIAENGAVAIVTRSLNGIAAPEQQAKEAATGTAGAGAGGGPNGQQLPGAPSRSSLSEEDRKRFGLDEEAELAKGAVVPTTHPRVEAPSADRPAAPAFKQDPAILWGGVGGSRDAQGATQLGQPSMSRTIAQLEAVGATKLLADLKESERRLQHLKMRG